MNPRTRALITVGLVITILTIFFLFVFVRQQKQAISDTVHNEQYSLQNQMELLIEQTAQHYKSRIKSLVTNRVQIMRAFAQKDRRELLKQASPLLKLFQKEDAYFKGIFFANPDNTIFLRVGMPEIYGDDVTHLSPLVSEVNRLKKMMAGFEITKPGLSYRILYPIFTDGDYIGLIGFIINADFFLDQLHQTSHAYFHNDSQKGTEIALVFPVAELDKAVFLNKSYRTIGKYVVFSDSRSPFQELPDHLDFDLKVQRLKFHGKTHALVQTGNFKNFKDNIIAMGFSLMDIENIIAETKRTIALTILFSFSLLFFSFVIIYFNFNILFKKITELNNSLTKSNKELEYRVEERTAELQKEIAERKEVEVSLMNSEEKYRSMMESMKDPVYICSSDYRIEYVNPAMIKRVGRDTTGENCFKALHNLNRKCPWCLHDKTLKGKQIESEIVSPLDNRSYNINHSPIVHTDGSISIMNVFRDITEHKTMQKALKEASNIINKSPAVAFLWKNNQAWSVEFVSENVKKLSGYSSEDFISGKVSYMDVIHPDDLKRVFEEISTSSNEKDKMDFAHKPYRIVTRKGDIKWLDDRTFIRKDRKSNITHYQGIVTDITDQKKLEKEKKELGLKLLQTQKMEAIGTLAGGIAHDFNNILFPIMGHTEMLMADVPENSPIKESLANIYAGAIRARDLVRQILTFSRQDSNELILMKIQPIIKEVLKLIRSTIPTSIDIKSDINPNCGVIKADPIQIHQIVMNLAINAYHAMEETGGELKVSLKEVKLGEHDIIIQDMISGVYACLIVADTGVGMDKDLTEKIFNPFFTTKGIGKGTGMGLSVVHGIVKGMGGDIQVYSEPGKGTEFHVYLPVVKNFSEKQVIHQMKEPIQGGIGRILLVDDEDAIITMEKLMLERLGYQVTSRTSSLEALEVFRDSPDKFNLVITDMAMPNMSGDKFAVELTKIRPDIPILLCTGFSEAMSEEKAESLGIKGFLLKPIVMKDLAQKIREALEAVNGAIFE